MGPQALVYLCLAIGLVVRLVLMGGRLEFRHECNTAAASIHALREGVFLYNNNASPYLNGQLHQPPVLVALLSWVPPGWWSFLALLADVMSVLLLIRARSFRAAATFALHPLLIASCAAGSPAGWAGPFLLWAHLRGSGTALGLAVTLQPIYILLLPVHAVTQGHRSVVHVLVTAGGLAMVSTGIMGGSIEWMSHVWQFAFGASDVTPNLGLYWYFFTELFPHFQLLYQVTWMLFLVFPLVAMSHALRHSLPSVNWFASLLVLAMLAPRPSAFDVGLAHIWFPWTWASLLATPVLFFTLALMMVFWEMWVHHGSGNANFYYAGTMVIAACHMFVLLDSVNAHLQQLARSKTE